MKGALAWATTLVVLLSATQASAHMMPAQQGTLNVLGDSVFQVLAVPVSCLAPFDDDGDGRLSDKEVAAHQLALQAEVGRRFRLSDGGSSAMPGSAQPGAQEMVLVRAETDERSEESVAGSKQLLALLKTRFPAPPHALRLETDLFGTASGEGQLTIRATRGKETEVAILRPLVPHHGFFRAPSQLFVDFVRVGVEHILFGFDHLLFLLTILVAARARTSARYWLAILTSFTVAHSITLALGGYGVASVAPRLVEPLIAASIVLMAVLNLRGKETSTTRRTAVVFACGLLHGLGFASAITGMGVVAERRAVSLIGFNVGIELGQALFLLALLAVLGLVGVVARRLSERNALDPSLVSATARSRSPEEHRKVLVRLVSLLAAILGAVWFFERLVASQA